MPECRCASETHGSRTPIHRIDSISATSFGTSTLFSAASEMSAGLRVRLNNCITFSKHTNVKTALTEVQNEDEINQRARSGGKLNPVKIFLPCYDTSPEVHSIKNQLPPRPERCMSSLPALRYLLPGAALMCTHSDLFKVLK